MLEQLKKYWAKVGEHPFLKHLFIIVCVLLVLGVTTHLLLLLGTDFPYDCFLPSECRIAQVDIRPERIGRRAFELARLRRKKVASVDKANVLETSRLWRSVMHRLAEEYSDVEYEDVLVDNAAMQLVRDPSQFDVVVTENMFGDILSDEASMITGSIGLLPSASIGDTAPGLYEPIHGSAPDIAGQDKANPVATILSVAMMFRYSFQLPQEAKAIEDAVDAVLNEGWRTADIAAPGQQVIGTQRMGQLIREKI